jgi:xylose isomerase
MAKFKFSFGPWNISEGADPFGPPVRPSVPFDQKLKTIKKLGFDGVQFHDDDAVPDIESKSHTQVMREAKEMKKRLDDLGLECHLAAPRLWEDPRGADGGFTANDPKIRRWAIERSKQCADVCRALGTDLLVLWLAREGTYIREAKDAVRAHHQIIEAIDAVLAHDKKIRIAIEPKPNEPMDLMYLPTIGHALALGANCADPKRVGALIESAHSFLAGLDASDDMAFAMSLGKLWHVHLNDQNGLKFDQDKSFGAANLRAAFNQVRVLVDNKYNGTIGLDVKAMRTTKPEHALKHLTNSREFFLALVEKVKTWDRRLEKQCRDNRDYEELERLLMRHLMGI